MGRYDGEEYEPVPRCRSGTHQPAFNGTCHVCRVLLSAKERRASERFQTVREHQRYGCPDWCSGEPAHRVKGAS